MEEEGESLLRKRRVQLRDEINGSSTYIFKVNKGDRIEGKIVV